MADEEILQIVGQAVARDDAVGPELHRSIGIVLNRLRDRKHVIFIDADLAPEGQASAIVPNKRDGRVGRQGVAAFNLPIGVRARHVLQAQIARRRPAIKRVIGLRPARGGQERDIRAVFGKLFAEVAVEHLVSGCVAGERGFDVDVSEPDVSPLAVQGPKAEDVVAALFGDWVRKLTYFWFGDAEIEGIPLKVARSGWSKQGGFELYLLDGTKGDRLWQIVREAGKPFDLGPGYPNPSERTESGLLNFGTDTDETTNPFEVRLERFVDLEVDDDVIGIRALRRIKAEGVKRHQRGIVLGDREENEDQSICLDIEKNGKTVGHMTHKAWSYRLKRMIGYALVSVEVQPGEAVEVIKDSGRDQGTLVPLPFSM